MRTEALAGVRTFSWQPCVSGSATPTIPSGEQTAFREKGFFIIKGMKTEGLAGIRLP